MNVHRFYAVFLMIIFIKIWLDADEHRGLPANTSDTKEE